MGQDLSTYDPVLKDKYEIGMRRAINDKATVVVPQLSKNGFKFEGRQVVWALHNRRSGATGARSEGEALPTPRNQEYASPKERLAFEYHTIKVTGQAARLTKGDEAAFAEALDEEIDRGVKDMMNDMARQILGQAVNIGGTYYNGVIGRVDNVAGDVLTINQLGDVDITDGEFRPFFEGMIVDIIDEGTNGTKNVDGNSGGSSPKGEIVAIDKTARTITLTDATGAVAGDYVVRQGTWNREINGLRELMDPDAPHAGLDPATTPKWAPVDVTEGTAEGISEDLMVRMHEFIETDGSGDTGEFFLAAHRQFRALANQLQSQKRYDGRDVTLKAGWKGLQVAEGTLARDKYMPDNKLFLLTLEATGWAVGTDFEWDTLAGGSILYKALDDTDAVQGRYLGYVQQIHKQRNSHAFADLTIPAT